MAQFTTVEQAAASLVDFSKPMDIAVLDQIVQTAYQPGNPQQQEAQLALVQLQDHQDMWRRADQILDQATNQNTLFFGLIVLTEAIKTRWQVLDGGNESRQGIKNFIVKKIIDISSDEMTMQRNRVFLQKMNLTLVYILKNEWPHNWPEFIPEIVQASTTNQSLCENNMQILKLLSEEVFEVKDQMTAAKTKTLKERLNQEFAQIFQLCDYVLQNSQHPTLLNVTLQTLQRFLTWIPLGYIFETNLIALLITKFFPVPIFRNGAIECLTEIAGLTECPANYEATLVQLYQQFLTQLASFVAPDPRILTQLHETDGGDHSIKLLALFFSSFFKEHLRKLETPQSQEILSHGLVYFISISEVDDPEIFKICLEYWHVFANELYMSETQLRSGQMSGTNGRGPLMLGGAMGNGGLGMGGQLSRKNLYRQDLLTRVRTVLIQNMAKPEEVVVVEDENGDVVREMQKDTEVIAQYKMMRETLVYLTHLDYDDTEQIMLEKLNAQVDPEGREWSWNNLNTLCWAIGSISGVSDEEEEKRFLVTVIKDLLSLCEEKRGKDNKAVIASNIMYVVGQYPRFLRAHWKFLKTVVNKLFEFMHERHPGVQDMACETFLKIAQKCKRKFVTLQQNEAQAFIVELADMIPTIIQVLEPHQVHTFYEAAACMLSERGVATVTQEMRQASLMKLLTGPGNPNDAGFSQAYPNQAWSAIMAAARQTDGTSLKDPETARQLQRFLKTSQRVCSAVGPLYVVELGQIYNDLMNVYTVYADTQKLMVDQQGEIATHNSLYKHMRSVKKETLRLLITFVEKCSAPEAPPHSVAQSLLPLLLQPTPSSVLGDYNRSIPQARDPEVLKLFSMCIEKLPMNEAEGGQAVPRVIDALFTSTLQMIVANHEDFPELRLQFFQLLKVINQHSFQSLFAIPHEVRKNVVDAVAFAIKHTERNVAETGLEMMLELLQNVDRHDSISQEFYQQFLLQLIQDVLYVMTDRLHKSGIKMHATLLKHMLHLVEMNKVVVPLFDVSAYAPGTTNPGFLKEFIGNLILTQFPNLTKQQVENFILGIFDLKMDVAAFKQHLRDFLVSLREFSDEDNNQQLFTEETEQQRMAAAEQEMARRQAIPGMMNPYEVGDDDGEML